ncbi:kelch domain-containing protein 10-like isoform X2 [Varroa destructor]|uniref:Kelch domain-containing protein 10 n=1 Tax=Varroa destructor TaxID=109461 RepID=A0A7M7J129_VARDE|nr:kelch domain-containing protein 10-like isoform X2 [Varroa destructor]
MCALPNSNNQQDPSLPADRLQRDNPGDRSAASSNTGTRASNQMMSAPYSSPTIIQCTGKAFPPRLSGHRVVCTDQCLYSFGGYAPQDIGETRLVTELWRFHFFRKAWTKVPLKGDVPKEVASSAATLLNNKILLLVGGTGIPFGQIRSRDVYACCLDDIDKDGAVTWVRWKTYGEIPEGLYGQAITVHGDYLYAVGGTDGQVYSIDVHRLDLRTRQWQRLSDDLNEDSIPARYRHEIAIYDDKIYVFGGGTPSFVYGFSEMPTFDLKTLKWSYQQTEPYLGFDNTEGPERPLPRRCHSAVQQACGEWVVVTGGVDERNQTFDDVWKLHLPTLRWHRLNCTLPKRVYFHSAAITATGCMYVFGGVVENGEFRTNDLCAMNVDVPTLQELAIETALASGLLDCYC